MQEVAGIDDKLTDSALYDVTKRELLASALPGKQPRQAPRFAVVILGPLESQCCVPGYADILESFVMVDVAPKLGNIALSTTIVVGSRQT